MKVLSIAASLALGLSVVSAHPILGSSIFVKRDVCPVDVDSCSPESVDVDTCCLPKNGFVKLSQQWHIKVGPADAFTIHGKRERTTFINQPWDFFEHTTPPSPQKIHELTVDTFVYVFVHQKGLWPDTCEGKMIGDCDSSRVYNVVFFVFLLFGCTVPFFIVHNHVFFFFIGDVHMRILQIGCREPSRQLSGRPQGLYGQHVHVLAHVHGRHRP